jgi:hypothetical protein
VGDEGNAAGNHSTGGFAVSELSLGKSPALMNSGIADEEREQHHDEGQS